MRGLVPGKSFQSVLGRSLALRIIILSSGRKEVLTNEIDVLRCRYFSPKEIRLPPCVSVYRISKEGPMSFNPVSMVEEVIESHCRSPSMIMIELE